MTVFTSATSVPVRGGELHVAVAGPVDGRPLALCAHGITASSRVWTAVVPHLAGAGVAVAAADLRGRGASAHLPGPFGMAAHAEDLVATLDHLSVERAVAVGHSMGAYVVARLAADHPDRVAGVVLVDGGLPLDDQGQPDDPQAALDELLGPAIARLRRTFASADDYVDFWRAHPAFAAEGAWGPATEEWVRYDVAGSPPEVRSRANEAAVREDGAQLFTPESGAPSAVLDARAPVVLLRAPFGLLGDPPPLVPEDVAAEAVARVDGMTVETVEGANHYTIVLAEPGAGRVASAVARLAGVPAVPQA